MYPILFSLIFSCLCCYRTEDQLSSPPYTSFHRARDTLLRMYFEVCRFALCICTLNRSLNLSSCCICIPLAPSCKYTCRARFLLSNVVYGVFAGKASPSQHYNRTLELSRRPGPAPLQHPARWMDPDQYQREKQSVIMRVIVGDVPNSGYMLRFTQEHARLRISTKPVDIVPRRHSTPPK